MVQEQIQAAVKSAIRTSSHEIILELNIEPLCNKLLAIPYEIRKIQSQMVDAQKKVDNAKMDAEIVKSFIVASVASETNDNGKPAFSNETARSAEITRRMSSEDYQVAKKALDEAEVQVLSLKFDIDRLNSEMSNLRAVISARAAQIQVLFGD